MPVTFHYSLHWILRSCKSLRSRVSRNTYLEEEAGDFFHGWVWLSKAETFRLARRATGREELDCG